MGCVGHVPVCVSELLTARLPASKPPPPRRGREGGYLRVLVGNEVGVCWRVCWRACVSGVERGFLHRYHHHLREGCVFECVH